MTIQPLKHSFLIVLASSLLSMSACAKEVDVKPRTVKTASVNTASVEKASFEAEQNSVVNTSVADREDISPKKESNSEWVKVSGPKEGAPTGNKKIPVLAELEPAEQFLNLAQYKGKVVYLDFWASWCVPCRDSFPFMNTVQEKYKDDLVVVAVNLDEEKANAEKFLQTYPSNFRIVYDQLWQAGRAYGIYGLPFSFVYNRKGELVGKHGGFKEGDEINLDAALKNLIELGE